MCTFTERKVCFTSALCYDSNQWPHQPSGACLNKMKGKHEQRQAGHCMALHTDLQFSVQHIDFTLSFPKKHEIGRNVLRNKGERNVCSIDIFFSNLRRE